MSEHPLALGILVSEKNWHSYYVRSIIRTAEALDVLAFRWTPEQLQKGDCKWMPTVVYNRIPTRKEEADQATRSAKGWLSKKKIPYFNARFFNKREVDRSLRSDLETAKYLPASWYLWDAQEIERKLQEFGSLYLKPIAGSLGMGICRLERNGIHYALETRTDHGVEVARISGKKEFYQVLRKTMGQQQWIVQEEIPLRTYRGRKTDFRVHVQRKPDGDFAVTGFAAKVSAKGAVTTHVRSGGSIEKGSLVLDTWYRGQADVAYDEMESAALTVSRKLAESLDPMLGELGLDMGFSKEGRLILFEANAKPGRAIFHHPNLRQANADSLQMLVHYAVSLCQNRNKTIAYQGVVS